MLRSGCLNNYGVTLCIISIICKSLFADLNSIVLKELYSIMSGEEYTYKIKENQEKNPVWKHINLQRKVEPLQVADFIYSTTRFAIVFISMKFHYKFPLYLKGHLADFVKSKDYFENPNRVLILLHDSSDPSNSLNEITMSCIQHNIKLILAFNYEDVAKCLKAFKSK